MVEEARKSGPQVIAARGKEAAGVLSGEEYRRIAPKKESPAEFLANSLLRGHNLEFKRVPDFDREIDL